jgi:ECF transporter S component (folate family)
MKSIKKIVFLSMLIALEVVLTRFLSITTLIVRIGFGFLPVAIAGIYLGPVYGAAAGAISDLIGSFLFPSGVYFPGITFTSALRGYIFGLIHYRRPITIKRIAISSVITTVICDLVLNTLWLHILTGSAYSVMILPRLIKTAIMIPVSIFLITAFWKSTKGLFSSKLSEIT